MRDFFVLINKPLEITSNDCVIGFKKYFFENYLKEQVLKWKNFRVGHSGTLDPLASGLMVIASGKATKMLQYLPGAKTYQFTIKFGEKTDTGDLEGNIIAEDANFQLASINNLAQIVSSFLGKIEQTPPEFSAIKINGKRAYELARKGAVVEIAKRIVEIFDLIIQKIDLTNNMLSVEAICSKGTYIRTLAQDIASKIGTIGVVTKLHRIAANGFDLPQKYENKFEYKDKLIDYKIINLDYMKKLYPVIYLELNELEKLSFGQKIYLDKTAFGKAFEDDKLIYSACNLDNIFQGLVKIEENIQSDDQGAVIFSLCMVKS